MSHKEIAVLYMVLSMLSGFISVLIRTELEIGMCYVISDYCGQVFNSVITLHGVGMIFLFIMPYLIGVVGNKEIPLKLSVADFQLPRLNILSL